MYDYIKSLESINPAGIKKSNLLGWHSESFNLEADEPKFFVNSISKNLNQMFDDMGWDLAKQEVRITSMWSIINKRNAR